MRQIVQGNFSEAVGI